MTEKTAKRKIIYGQLIEATVSSLVIVAGPGHPLVEPHINSDVYLVAYAQGLDRKGEYIVIRVSV